MSEPNKRRLSSQGLDLLKQLEGFSAVTYLCAAGVSTIGYGHAIKANERISPPISVTDAEALLRRDAETAENIVNAMAAGKGSLNGGFRLDQNQFDALVLLVFNIGVGNFKTSTLLRRLQEGDKKGAAVQFLVWNKITVDGKKQINKGLTNRREREKALFEGEQ